MLRHSCCEVRVMQLHDILQLRTSVILPEAISDGGLAPTTDTSLFLTTYRGESHLPSDIFVKRTFAIRFRCLLMNAVALQPAFKMQKNRHIRDGFSLTLGILKIKCFAILFYYVSLCFLIWNQHDQSCSDNVNYNKYNIWQCKTSSGNFQ